MKGPCVDAEMLYIADCS